jgi:hypothetical protein
MEEALGQIERDVVAGKLDPIAVDALKQVVADQGIVPQVDSTAERAA